MQNNRAYSYQYHHEPGEDDTILYPLQHGFRRSRSCETQLIEFVDDLTSNLDERLQVDILVLDFDKS